MASVQYLKGVGPTRARHLAKLDIFSVEDLVHHYPRSYQRRRPVSIASLAESSGKLVLVNGTIVGTPRVTRRRVSVLTATVSDGSGHIKCTWFNQNYLASRLQPGTTISVAGKYSREYGNIVVEEHSFEESLPEIQPQYPLTEGISNAVLVKIIKSGLEKHREAELFPADFREEFKLTSAQGALESIHQPQSLAMLKQARYTLKFRELFLYQLSFLYWRRLRQRQLGRQHRRFPHLQTELEKFYGFSFTRDQVQAMGEIEADLSRSQPMNRLLQGDVGSGKTVVAVHAMFTCAMNGFKAVLMVPTEIVARQHYDSIAAAARQFSVPVHLLTGSSSKSERDQISSDLEAGGGAVLVGTHAVFQESVTIRDLSLVVTDEQHRFGVQQRFALAQKGENPHVLAMSATPIPRTMAMTIYGDLDVSTLQTKPGGRRQVKTYVVPTSRRKDVFAFIQREISRGNTGYIVCPLIEESEKINALSLEKYQEILAQGLPDSRFGILHGRMSGAEKEQVVNSLKEGEIDLLLSTTVVEVGVDIGNATFMVIEDSQRYGLAQLHQLRGRVGRRDKQSYCFLLTPGSETERLKILEQINDGFAVSLEDLKLRGGGQFLGRRQHGLNEFKLADITKDRRIAEESRTAAIGILDELDAAGPWKAVYKAVSANIANLKS